MKRLLFDPLRPMSLALTSVLSLALLGQMGHLAVAQDEKQEQQDEVDVAELMQQGQMALGNAAWGKAADAFRKATKADAKNGMAWHLLGYALHSDGKLDEAIKMHTKAATFETVKGISLYNLGCAYSLKKDTKKSIKYLHESLDAGFDQFDNFASDADLVNVRKAKGYQSIAARLKNGGKRPKFNTKKIVGTWKVIKGMRAGEAVDEQRLPEIVITKNTITIPAGPEKFVMEYKINTDKRPAQIDMSVAEGPAPEDSKALGLIRRSKNNLVLIYDPMGATRPQKFQSTEENG